MDEEDMGGLEALSAMVNGGGGGGQLDPDAKRYAMSILEDESSRNTTDETFRSLESDAAMARQALTRARERLTARPAYDQRDKYLAVAGAILGQGSTSGRFGEGIGRAATALGQERKAERQALTARDGEEFSLDKELYGVDSSVNSAKRTLALKREELQTNLKRAALTALKQTGGAGAGVGDGIGKVNPGDYDPASLQAWARSRTKENPRGNLALLRRVFAPAIVTIGNVPNAVTRGSGGAGTPQPLGTLAGEATGAATVAAAEATAKGEAAAEVDRNTAASKKATDATNTLGLLDGAEQLIYKSTGSLIGTGVDLAAGAAGYATEGAKAIGELKILQAGLMTNMPRMEGPQSDRDVQLYREAAAQIGDSTVPRDVRIAAVGTIRRLQQKYIDRAPAAAKAPAAPAAPPVDLAAAARAERERRAAAAAKAGT